MKCPNMEAARLKIVAVLKEHDLMGAVMIAGKKRSGFFQEVSPSWSCARVDESPAGVGVRVKCKREDYPSAEAQKRTLALTVGGIMGILGAHRYIGQFYTSLVQMISNKVEIHSVITDVTIQQAQAEEDGV